MSTRRATRAMTSVRGTYTILRFGFHREETVDTTESTCLCGCNFLYGSVFVSPRDCPTDSRKEKIRLEERERETRGQRN